MVQRNHFQLDLSLRAEAALLVGLLMLLAAAFMLLD